MTKKEIRTANIEMRQVQDGVAVEGYAATFNDVTNIADFFEERILPGAFSEAIVRDDVILNVDHSGLPLARTASGTLSLSEDDHGLKISTRLDPSDPDVQRIVPKMERGDLSKMSFAFTADEDDFEERDDELPLRTIKKATLYDVSIVTVPAYNTTEVGLRSLAAAQTRRITDAGMQAERRRLMEKKFAE